MYFLKLFLSCFSCWIYQLEKGIFEHLDMEKLTNVHSEVDSEENEEVSRVLGKIVKKSSKKS